MGDFLDDQFFPGESVDTPQAGFEEDQPAAPGPVSEPQHEIRSQVPRARQVIPAVRNASGDQR